MGMSNLNRECHLNHARHGILRGVRRIPKVRLRRPALGIMLFLAPLSWNPSPTMPITAHSQNGMYPVDAHWHLGRERHLDEKLQWRTPPTTSLSLHVGAMEAVDWQHEDLSQELERAGKAVTAQHTGFPCTSAGARPFRGLHTNMLRRTPSITLGISDPEPSSLSSTIGQRWRNAPARWGDRLSKVQAPLEDVVVVDAAKAPLQLGSSTANNRPQVATLSTASQRDLDALFFTFDKDSSGEIDRQELDIALEQLGFALSPSYIDALFAECDTNNSGSLTREDFKKLITMTGLTPSPQLKYAMDLFQSYDDNDSGIIDKFKFKAIASDILQDQQRRTLIACAASAAAATIVAKFSDEYLWAQKNFRGFYLEQKAEAAQRASFPTALLSSDLDAAVARTLATRGYSPDNTLFAHSVCSDEVNNKNEELVALMVSRWHEGFALGGLGGLPFAGKSGFRAYLHHVPDRGRLLVLFAPHVGIDESGTIGALQRDGQTAVSKACGAGIGAYKALLAKATGAPPKPDVVDNARDDPFDPELATIIDKLAPRIKKIEGGSDPITFVTYQMYAIVRELIDSCIDNTDDVWSWASEVTVIGGIMINRRTGGDFFQPLSFEARRPNGQKSVDLYEQTFGAPPDLVSVLGSKSAVKELYSNMGNA